MLKKLVLIAVPMLVVALPFPAQGEEFRIVVHADNPVDELSAETVAKMFLKTIESWDDGTPVMPVDRGPDAEVRELFSRAVLDRDVSAVRSYWSRQVDSGRGNPPDQLRSDDAVLGYVRDNLGAIGYVSAGAPLPRGVRALKLPGGEADRDRTRIVAERGAAQLLLAGTCGEEGQEAILRNRDEHATVSVSVETSRWADERLKAKSVKSHTLDGGEEKRLGCTRRSASVEVRYDLVKASSNAEPRGGVFARPLAARDFISIVRSGTCGRDGAGEHVVVINKSGEREISALIEHVVKIDGKLKNRSMRSYSLRPGSEKKLGCSRDGSVEHEYALLQTN